MCVIPNIFTLLNKKNLFARAEFLDANKDLKKINDKILDLGIKNAKKNKT